ncbi:MAG: precorrin-4/cobalt-precorrin-4 C11-methyltransferase [Methanothermococcus sp.]|jgi:precorrin-4/cobalt-precorrin-4 C11-methyltransferase|uniref:precorrin-4 C(11)-methyltransferase n=1 Tax=Methanothermococcus TaxID=155862 RepID=UPI00037AB53E|nr:MULTISPECIES: precorrin-4 C(11)-methyltransferase [Methanothermococcus]MDK2790251.1 precorrin-4/cobalt-precorrin-4 C11-methyltransferase [Methanothermococcus sp.]MDK2987642.1 precorrin-4/cobalt-precorrin-4 C11-methyltransferase [Methanothermococcus sp.]
MKKVIIVGAGPGDKELITVKGKKAIENADIIVYAGSLVNKEVLEYNKKNAKIYNSATMDLDEIVNVMVEGIKNDLNVVRVHTGDPSIYGAIKEQIDELRKYDIDVEIIPGVTSLFAAAATLKSELTLPKVSQTVIITRPEGKTPKPEKEKIKNLAKHQATMAIYLGVGMIEKVCNELVEGGYPEETPVAVVYHASWEDEKIIRGKLNDIAEKVKEAGIKKTALIIVGDVLDPDWYEYSKLYDKDFETEYRKPKL